MCLSVLILEENVLWSSKSYSTVMIRTSLVVESPHWITPSNHPQGPNTYSMSHTVCDILHVSYKFYIANMLHLLWIFVRIFPSLVFELTSWWHFVILLLTNHFWILVTAIFVTNMFRLQNPSISWKLVYFFCGFLTKTWTCKMQHFEPRVHV